MNILDLFKSPLKERALAEFLNVNQGDLIVWSDETFTLKNDDTRDYLLLTEEELLEQEEEYGICIGKHRGFTIFKS
jgi:co-chaperonin GroES (HSP10)